MVAEKKDGSHRVRRGCRLASTTLGRPFRKLVAVVEAMPNLMAWILNHCEQ
jgi:hypothetical protein